MGASPADRRRQHWEDLYGRKTPTEVSWYQPEPSVSLDLFDQMDIARDAAVIDVGGGASALPGALEARGYTDVTVLDVSATALAACRRRAGPEAHVSWLEQDILTWQPPRRFGVWHDRAVFHFFLAPEDRRRYLSVLMAALLPDATVILGAFAADGPLRCSGLPVARYDRQDLADALGSSFRVMAARRELHTTPQGVVQPFSWVAARRSPDAHSSAST